MKKHIFQLLLGATMLAVGCKNEAEQIPAYLRIEPFTVNENGGAAWQKITDGWLYVNGEFLGAYTLPATVPVLAAGESDILLFPGVKENGIIATPNIYPFLKRYEGKATLTPPDIVTVQPSTAYDPGAKFPWGGRGDFDAASTLQFEDRDSDEATTFELTTDGAFVGKSLRMKMDTAHQIIAIASEEVELPATAAKEVWLEMHYKSDMPFTLYLLFVPTGSSSEVSQPIFQFNGTEGNWNKIYLNLTEFLIAASTQNKYRLFFQCRLPRDDAGKISQNNGTVWLDNIRLAHF